MADNDSNANGDKNPLHNFDYNRAMIADSTALSSRRKERMLAEYDQRKAEESGDGTTPRGGGGSSAVDRKSLKASEEEAANDRLGGGYHPEEPGRVRRFITRRKVQAAGALVGAGLTGGVIGTSFLAGPLQFVHLAQVLHNAHFSQQEDAGDGRMGKMYRWLRSGGSAGETRLGWLGSKYHGRILADLASIGIVPDYGNFSTYKGFTVDLSHPDTPYTDMTPREAATAFEQNTGIKPTINGNRLQVDANTYWSQRKAIKASLGELNLNGVSTDARARVLRKFGLVSWHPMNIIDKKANNTALKIFNLLKEKWQTRLKTGVDPVQIDASAAREQTGVDSKGNPITTNQSATVDTSKSSKISDTLKSIAASKTLRITGGLGAAVGLVCAAKAVDDHVDEIRYAQIIAPLTRMGMDAITVGNQIMSGQDVDPDEVNYLAQSFNEVDSKGNVISNWNSAVEIRASTGQSGGVDPMETNGTKDLIGQHGVPWLDWTQNALVGALCSTAGQVVNGVVSVAIGIFSGGAVSTAAGFVASSIGGPLVIDKLSHLLAGEAADTAAHGALYGAETAYGAAFGANDSSVHTGGVALTSAEATKLSMQTQQEQRQAFDSESFFARTFDMTDYRSLAGHLADALSVSPTANAQGLLGTVMGAGSSAMQMPFNLIPNIAHADVVQPYDYPFSEYDFSQADLDNKTVGDPYVNAETVAKMLDTNCLNSDGTTNTSCSYIQKAETCFGDQISKDNSDHVWDVIPDQDVNMYSKAYDASGCRDAGNAEWLRVRMFILDTGVMEGYTCAQYDDPTSCQNNGAGTTAATTPATPSTSGTSLPSGSSQQLAKLILASPNITFQTPQEGQDFQEIVNTGHQTNCGNPAISPKLLGIILTASQKYKLVLGVFDDGHHCGDGLHDIGIAVDINGITPLDNSFPSTGNFINWNSGEQPLLKQFYAYMAGLLSANGGGAIGQQLCFTTETIPPKPNNVLFFPDSCDHVHVDVR